MNREKVLMIVESPMNNAGVQNVVMDIIRNLNEQYCFDVLTYSHERGFFDDEIRKYGGKIYGVDLISYEGHKLTYLHRLKQLESVCKKLMNSNHYDIVHCHNGFEAGVCLKVAAEFGIKKRISHAHGHYTFRTKNPVLKRYYKVCRQYTLKYSTMRLACSQIAGCSLFGKASFNNIYNPVDYRYFSAIKKKAHDGINLLQIGYYHKNKNQLFTIDILKKLVELKTTVHLYFIGYILEQNYYQYVLSSIRESGLSEYVTFYDAGYDKGKLLGTIDYVLVPSISEGLSMVALESQAADIPVVCSNGVPKDVDFGGCIFPGNNVNDWVKTIINNKEKSLNVSEKLRELDVMNYTRLIEYYYSAGIQ